MRALTNLLLASSSLLGLAGCLPDFSPDPLNDDSNEVADGGIRVDGGGDAARPSNDSGSGGTRDTGMPGPTPGNDSGGPAVVADGGGDQPGPAPTECNLTGKWLVTERFGMEGLGAKQNAWGWFYVEIEQSGTQLTYKKSLACGANVSGIGIPVTMDDSAAWPAYTMNPANVGRKGTIEKVADGCMMHVDKDAVVRGATVEYYRDLNVPLPKIGEQENGDTPGWADWDNDGEPGVTLKIQSLSSGNLMCVMRNWSEYNGVIPDGATNFQLTLTWGQTRSTLKADNDFLRLDATVDPDSSRTAVEWGRLTDEQAAGDDLTICKSVRDLAKTLTPIASMTK